MNESIKIYKRIKYFIKSGNGLDLGCGPYKISNNCIGVDPNCGDIKEKCLDYLKTLDDNSIDWIFSSHYLEHEIEYSNVLNECKRVLVTGGYLILYLPEKTIYKNKNGQDPNSDHVNRWKCSDFEKILKLKEFLILESQIRNTVPNWYSFTGNGFTENEKCAEWEYSFLIIAKNK